MCDCFHVERSHAMTQEHPMKPFNRHSSSLFALAVASMLSTLSASGADLPSEPTAKNDAETSESQSCHMKTRRIVIWPHGPRRGLREMPRFETRTDFVCDRERTMKKRKR
jgi:hypothetical protein